MVTWTERDPPDWRVYCLTIHEAAQCLGVHHNTIRKLIAAGDIKGYKNRRANRWQWMVPMWSLYDYQKERAEKQYQALKALASS